MSQEFKDNVVLMPLKAAGDIQKIDNRLLIITGPTAVGKTEIAIKLAIKFDGEIISADSMQIYKGFDIGTGKVTKEETQSIPHHMLDIVQPTESYSAAQYVSTVKKVIDDIYSRNKLPIMVGGTGLYIKGLLNDFAFGNVDKDLNLRNYYQNILSTDGKEKLFEILKNKDPEAAKNIDPNKTRAVIRALEVFDKSGKKFSEVTDGFTDLTDSSSEYNYLLIALTDDREALYKRINARVDNMFESGLVEEVKGLRNSGVSDSSQSMRGIGYKEILAALNGDYDLNRAKELVKQHARNYAKRQMTWLKGMQNVERYNYSDYKKIVDRVKSFLLD